MDVGGQIDYLRKEHQDILEFLGRWEHALSLLSSTKDAQRSEGLTQLRDLEGDLLAIRDHRFVDESKIEAPYGTCLREGHLEKLTSEHGEIGELVENLRSALRFATLEHLEDVPELGRQLAEFVWRHILFEEKLLVEIEKVLTREEMEKVFEHYTQSAT